MGSKNSRCLICNALHKRSNLSHGYCKSCIKKCGVKLVANLYIQDISNKSKRNSLSPDDMERIRDSTCPELKGEIASIYNLYDKYSWDKDDIIVSDEFEMFLHRYYKEIFGGGQDRNTGIKFI